MVGEGGTEGQEEWRKEEEKRERRWEKYNE